MTLIILEDCGHMNLSFFSGKRVLLTGHTGFKGSWLSEILLDAGAVLTGYSLEPPTEQNLFSQLNLSERLDRHHVIGDIRDLSKLKETFDHFKPEIVIHMAAQPIVRESYKNPVLTYDTNVMGTVNLLECVRLTPSVKSVLNVTTDKVYENFEKDEPYREDDRLDGFDPYSNSKSCSELVTHAYKKSFLDAAGIAVSTARAGNVIGGGDYAADRLIPDCVRSALKHESVILRNPASVRPFQHVLEPLYIYLSIAEAQYEDPSYAGYYNVGPDKSDCLTAGALATLFCEAYGEGLKWIDRSDGGPHEAKLLMLDNSKIREVFGWTPGLSIEEAVNWCADWVKAEDKIACTRAQITAFFEKKP